MVKWRAEFELARRGRSTMWALSICVILACLTAAVLFLTLPGALASPKTYDDDYGIMIDAGSSGSRLFLYTWPHRKTSQIPVVRALLDPKTNTSLVMKILPGLQAYQVRVRCIPWNNHSITQLSLSWNCALCVSGAGPCFFYFLFSTALH